MKDLSFYIPAQIIWLLIVLLYTASLLVVNRLVIWLYKHNEQPQPWSQAFFHATACTVVTFFFEIFFKLTN